MKYRVKARMKEKLKTNEVQSQGQNEIKTQRLIKYRVKVRMKEKLKTNEVQSQGQNERKTQD